MQASPATSAPRVIGRFFEFSMLGMLGTGYLAVLGTRTLDWPSATVAFGALIARGLMAGGVVRVHLPARVATHAWYDAIPTLTASLIPATAPLPCQRASPP